MAYLILSDRDGEFDRRELRGGPVVIGRSPDSTICVRDILLSRKHCKLELYGQHWVVTDLGSKNGTHIGEEIITRQVLREGDVMRVGKIQISFHADQFVPLPAGQQRRRDVRPTDPHEALSGTVVGFQLFDMEADARVSGFPIPKPKPAEPVGSQKENVRSVVSEIASTQWDKKIMQTETRPKAASQANPGTVERPRPRELEKTVRPAPKAAERERPAPPLRSAAPDRRATIPGWLAVCYILMACAVGGAAIGVVVARSILPFSQMLAR